MEQLHPLLQQNEYLIRRKFIFGRFFKVYDPNGAETLFIGWEPESIKVFSDENKMIALLKISFNRPLIDQRFEYIITDLSSDTRVGCITQSLYKTMVRNKWDILSADNEKIGTMQESSLLNAILNRSIGWIYPQKYIVESLNGDIIARIEGASSFFNQKNKLNIENMNLLSIEGF